MNQSTPGDANAIIEGQLQGYLQNLEQVLEADVLTFCGPIAGRMDDLVRDAVELRQPKRTRLAVILETQGGHIEVAQRIADTLRHHYANYVEFIIPNYAMSAGTVLVMSGDLIRMDYYSVLGPIDPQVQRPGSQVWIPALGYLVQYQRLIDKSKKGVLTTAEATFLIEKFDPAELYRYEQERELSITLLKEWLVKYKFKNWTRTATRGLRVTKKMRDRRAAEIAEALNATDRWHSHARGISMSVLRDQLNLRIEDFGQDPRLNVPLRMYYRLLTDYMMKRGQDEVLSAKGLYVPIMTVQG